jgi:hypothetical protein
MRKITIISPIWKTRSIGIADYKITDDIEIEILYRYRTGERVYPGIFFISKDKARSFPIQTLPGGVRLRIIPITELEPL